MICLRRSWSRISIQKCCPEMTKSGIGSFVNSRLGFYSGLVRVNVSKRMCWKYKQKYPPWNHWPFFKCWMRCWCFKLSAFAISDLHCWIITLHSMTMKFNSTYEIKLVPYWNNLHASGALAQDVGFCQWKTGLICLQSIAILFDSNLLAKYQLWQVFQ